MAPGHAFDWYRNGLKNREDRDSRKLLGSSRLISEIPRRNTMV